MAWWWPESMILMLILKVTDIVYSIVYMHKFKICIYIWTVICICAKIIKIEFKKEVRIASKYKEISSYPVRNSYMLAITHQSALPTVSLVKCMWLKVMDINSVVYLQDLITT